MRFKTDENLPAEAVDLLRNAGHDASSVLEQDTGGDNDSKVVAVCLREQRALLTLDLDFADIRTYPPEEYHGLLVLRPSRQDRNRVVEVLSRLLPMLATEKLAGKLWIADERRVRIRD